MESALKVLRRELYEQQRILKITRKLLRRKVSPNSFHDMHRASIPRQKERIATFKKAIKILENVCPVAQKTRR